MWMSIGYWDAVAHNYVINALRCWFDCMKTQTWVNLLIWSFQTLSVTDDTVLEEHNEDPGLIQMRLIDDGGKLS